MSEVITVISQSRLDGMLAADMHRYGFVGDRTDEVGLRWSTWKDLKSGALFAVRLMNKLYMGFNENEPERIEMLKTELFDHMACRIEWGGVSKFYELAVELSDMLPDYDFRIDYEHFECVVSRKGKFWKNLQK